MLQRRYGVATPEELAGLTGREVLEAMIAGRLPFAPMYKTLAIDLVEVGDGMAVFEGDPHAALLNPAGTVHGGWSLALIDSATGCAAHTTLGPGIAYTTVETKGNFSRPITPDTGVVRCTGRVLSKGRTIITSEASVTDATGRVLGHGTSTLLVLGPR